MAKKQLSKKEQKEIKRYHDAFEAKQELHKLMIKVAYITGLGEEEDDYTKTISLEIGNGTLSYDPYYQQVWYYDNEDDSECQIEEDDLQTITKLIKEINQRFKEFERKNKKTREKSAEECFKKPIESIIYGAK